MAAKMAVYYKYIRKFSLGRQTPGICMQNAAFTDSSVADIILVASHDAANASLRIWYIQDGIQNGSW